MKYRVIEKNYKNRFGEIRKDYIVQSQYFYFFWKEETVWHDEAFAISSVLELANNYHRKAAKFTKTIKVIEEINA
jgi:DUF1365 family protein